jgi:hypothetical protein
LAAGRVAGKAYSSPVWTLTQAEGCDDRNGGNSFQLRSTASQAVEKYPQSHTGERSIGFAFHGHITRVQGENLLIIEQVDGLRSAQHRIGSLNSNAAVCHLISGATNVLTADPEAR